MARIKFVHRDEVIYVDRSLDSARAIDVIPRTNRTKVHLDGAGRLPHLFEPGFAPGTGAKPHAHGVDEVFHVLDGELRFGERVLPEGSTIFIPAHTVYSFTAGDGGCRFLNFRAGLDTTLFTPDDAALADLQSSARPSSARPSSVSPATSAHA